MTYVITMSFASDRPTESWSFEQELPAKKMFGRMVFERKRYPDFTELSLRDHDGQCISRLARR